MQILNWKTSEVILEIDSLRGADLRDADLQFANLRDADLQFANLQDADLRGANLRYAYLRDAELENVNLQSADLRGADLRGTYLRDADLRGANLEGAKFFTGIETTKIEQIKGLTYPIYLLDSHIKIGCELHSVDEWRGFSDSEIDNMDSGALEFWSENKERLLCKY